MAIGFNSKGSDSKGARALVDLRVTEMLAPSHGLPLPTFLPSGNLQLSYAKHHRTPTFQTQKCTFLYPWAFIESDVQ